MAPSLRRCIFLALAAALAASTNPLPSTDTDLVDKAEDGVHLVLDNGQAAAVHGHDARCTSTSLLLPSFTWGPIRTVWTTTSTSTRLIDCGGCDKYTISYLLLGVPPVAFFTTTTTATGPSITEALRCGHNPTAVATPAVTAEAGH